MEDVSDLADRMGNLAVDRRFQIVPDKLKSFLVFGRAVENLRQAIQIAGRVEPVETDDIPIGVFEQMLDQMMADEPGPSRH